MKRMLAVLALGVAVTVLRRRRRQHEADVQLWREATAAGAAGAAA